MMRQYNEIKDKHKDCILFFRLGDFYEMFYDDAVTASRELEITLTGKSSGDGERAPMCGVPYHAAEAYLAKLAERGHKVAICEQIEDSEDAKGIVKREVIRIVTPGTLTGRSMLRDRENNYLAALLLCENRAGLVFCDISTGEMNGCEIEGGDVRETLLNEMVRIKVCEALLDPYAAESGFADALQKNDIRHITPLPAEDFAADAADRLILHHFGVRSLAGLGIEEKPCLTRALGGLLRYLNETQKQTLAHINRLRVYALDDRMSLDKATIRNLELTETLYGEQQGSLLGVLDRTLTAMGGRLIRQWLRAPLNRCAEITARLDAVECLKESILSRNNMRALLKGMYDLERLSGRLSCGGANGKDMIALQTSLALLPDLKADLEAADAVLLRALAADIEDLSEAEALIAAAVREDAPHALKDGGLIRDGYSEELDALKLSIRDGRKWIASLEGAERARTGVKNLKVGYNKVFGYYIEITRSYFDQIPAEYIRKQTLANCERFVTPELKEVESVVLNAETKINKLEYELFCGVRDSLLVYAARIQKAAATAAATDVLLAFAETAEKLGYVKPEVNDGDVIAIEKGRHPVVERTITGGVFVSNDLWIDRGAHSLLLITGPNMAGKSTYMRQAALIVLMAQTGSFVPAEKAVIGVVDRIYTRIGASDNLARGQSTFYVEMSELAYILNTASARSLIILDEIGRGTSTYDGLSIAWAVAERLCSDENRVRTLFATHYHELTALEGAAPGLTNLNVDVSETDGEIVFLHKIVAGSASRSYGIHVAGLAGVPRSLLAAAEAKLRALEDGGARLRAQADSAAPAAGAGAGTGTGTKPAVPAPPEQLSFFSFAPNPVLERLKALDLMEIKPSEAFSILEALQEAALKDRA
jgi:DNA mismatch repair protein MutS